MKKLIELKNILLTLILFILVIPILVIIIVIGLILNTFSEEIAYKWGNILDYLGKIMEKIGDILKIY